MRVMTFNVRGSAFDRGEANAWENRAAMNVAVIRDAAPDLIGFQELQRGNLRVYEKELPGYERLLGPGYGVRRPRNFNALYFDPDRLEATASGGFWLSKTPERFSRSWRSAVVRSANWVRFRHRESGSYFLHLNTHLDHKSERARIEGSRLILSRLAEIRADLPVILTGDFNCIPGSHPYRIFTEGGFTDVFALAGSEEMGTFHAFKGARYAEIRGREPWRLDWILIGSDERLRVLSCQVLRDGDEESGIYPSDHYPIVVDLSLADA